jgi:hypothetical protein
MEPLPPQYGETMSCPFTGLAIPKTTAGNLAWRKQLLAYGKSSSVWRNKLRSAASSSPIFWLNAFGWTFLQKKIAADGHEAAVYGELSHVPFITWKIQDEALVDLVKAVDGGKDALIQKTRDMGASWLIVSLFQWYWQFRPSTTFLELSRKQSLVDRRGDMDSLFEKHRYLLKWQPEWLRPRRIVDNLLHLENQDNGSTIEGESTNENAGQASRKTAILLDEFARVPNGEEIDLATADTTSCRIFNSTPQGPNTQFSRIYRGIKGGSRAGVLITLPWFRHPDKGAGATVVKDDQGIERYSSPWYVDQIKRRSKRNVAQNIDMEHGRSGDMFFDADEIESHRRMYQSAPLAEGNVRFDEDLNEEKRIAIIRAGLHSALTWTAQGTRRPWRLWVPLINGRPNQETRYVFGVDISNGSGASNSVISVLDHTSNMIVAKFWDAFTSPEDLATMVAMAGVWFGGKKLPYVTFEKNGPGVIFGRKLLKLGYPSIYYQKVETTKVEQKTTRWGWQSSTSRKELMLGQYRDALKTGAIINPCKEALDEAGDYVYDDNGKIEPGSMGVEEGGGGALHGDHVIADGLCVLGRADLPKREPVTPAHIPQGTYADRRRLAKKKQTDREAWSR